MCHERSCDGFAARGWFEPPAPSRVNGHLEVTLYGCCELWPHPMVLARSRTATEVSAQLFEVCVR